MNKWIQTSIGEFIDFNPSESIKKDEIARKIPMDKLGTFQRKINGSEYSKYSAGPKFRNEDTLVAKITPCLENGKTAYVDSLEENEVAFGSSEFIVLRENQNSNSKFIYYLARSPLFRDKAISCMEGTSGRKRVNEGALKRQEILVPKLKSDQQKIASVLSALDDKIELNLKINVELEQMAKTLYDYWFVQFDFPDANGKPYKSSGGEMVYDTVLKRDIPKGWEVKNLSSFIGNDKSGDWGKENEEGNYIQKVECVRGADINGINGKGEIKAPTRYILEKNSHKILAPNDFVVEISGGSPVQSTGRIACITDDVLQRFSNPLICSNFCKAVSLKSSDEVFYFLCSWNRAYDNSILFSFEGKTSGIKNLLFDDFVTAYMVAKPTDSLLKDFNEKISLFEKKRQENLKQNQELAQLRDWLLPMLMNGQITVGNAEEMVNEQLDMVAEGGVDYKKK
jgi:type I restriction enzyme S subunit